MKKMNRRQFLYGTTAIAMPVLGGCGGDEFVVFLKHVDRKKASEIAERILSELRKPVILDNHINYISGSIGIVIIPDDAKSAEEAIKNADTAMYAAKKGGKDRFEFFMNKMSEDTQRKLILKNNLYNALKKDELIPFFQPQMDKNDNLYGSEVLVRWIKMEK